MKWNRKGIVICTVLFLGVLIFMLGKAFFPDAREDSVSTTYASEEEVVFPTVETDMGVTEEQASAVPEKKSMKKPTATPKSTASVPTPDKPSKEATKKGKKAKTDREEKKQGRTSTPKPIPTMTAKPMERKVSVVSFSIECTAIMEHRDLWNEGIEEIIPSSGYFYQGEQEISEGETVYDVLKRICSKENIALDVEYTPIYGTYYVKGIGNLYEFDCGSESGWQYKVNDVLGDTGCSSYLLKNGDRVTFFYDCQYGQ